MYFSTNYYCETLNIKQQQQQQQQQQQNKQIDIKNSLSGLSTVLPFFFLTFTFCLCLKSVLEPLQSVFDIAWSNPTIPAGCVMASALQWLVKYFCGISGGLNLTDDNTEE